MDPLHPVTEPRVMIVDDDPAIRSLLTHILEGRGYHLRTAADGIEALELFRGEPADLVLSDLQMPRMGGLPLLRELKALDPAVGVIILTGAGTVDDAIHALRLHADDYLVKPFHVDEVLVSAERTLAHRRLVLENQAYRRQLEEKVASQAMQLEALVVDALRSLASAIETRDSYTGGHVERVARYAAATGRELGLRGGELHALWIGALLHDVGKIGVADSILRKPGPLTDAEYEEIKRHPEIGAGIMERSSFLRPGLPAVLHHQECWDGSGYPAGLRGEAISLEGRIVAVVDTFDAIVTSRPYREERGSEDALAEIRRCAGTQFDPRVVEAFVRAAARDFPPDPATPALPESPVFSGLP